MTNNYPWWERFTIKSLYPMLLSPFADIPMEERAETKILELAAGAGALTIPLAAAGFNITPSDLFPEALGPRVQGLERLIFFGLCPAHGAGPTR